MTKDHYREGRNYELFIRKAFNCKRGKKYGANESLMIKLFINEQGKEMEKPRVSYNRQLFKVRLHIEKALVKLKKKKKYVDSYNHFSPILMKLRKAKTPEDLAKIVNASLSKIIVLENQLKRRNI